MMTLQQIARAMGGEVCGNQVRVPGPGHSSEDRSLSVKLEADAPGGFIVHSFSGDDPLACKDYLREKLGLPTWNGSSKGKTITWAYDYTDEAGDLLFQVVRYFPKNFRQRCPNGKGGWNWSVRGRRRVPYRLPEIMEAVRLGRVIFIVEGEKAVDALVELGIAATCSPGGVERWRDEYSRHVANADVLILPDNDEPGERHCKAVAKSLTGVAARVRVYR